MPWKEEKNPYFIWLSEIILQQTRVDQGWDYYLKFIKLFPTVRDLANADLNEVLKAWEGLGYYSRARNLHFAANQIVQDFDASFPTSKKELLKLKGVGEYTASAIASFAFNLPHAVVDGNVVRVLSRFLGINTPFDTTEGKKLFAELAQNCLNHEQPATHNQAIMDFGATICTPNNPFCEKCILKEKCFAYKHNAQNKLPIKSKKIIKKLRFFIFLEIEFKDLTYLEERTSKDIWKNLYQLPLIEVSSKIEINNLLEEHIYEKLKIKDFKVLKVEKGYKQVLTHQKIDATFVKIKVNKSLNGKFIEVKHNNLHKFAFPKIINLYFKK